MNTAVVAIMVLALTVPAFAVPLTSPAFTSTDRISGGSPSCGDSDTCQGGSGGIFPVGCTLDPVTGECVQPVSTPGGGGTSAPGAGTGGQGGLNYAGEGSAEPGGAGGNCNIGVNGCVGSPIQGPPTG